MLIRAQVGEAVERDANGAAEGADVQVRLIGCEEESAAEQADAAMGDAAAGSLLRLLHDLRVGVCLAATEDGDCVEASFSIREESPSRPDAEPIRQDRPLAFQLCGLPIGEGESDS